VVVGHNESFRCEVLSDLHPHVEWFRGYFTSLNETETNNVVKVYQPSYLWVLHDACILLRVI
jgi:hypothetical protein